LAGTSPILLNTTYRTFLQNGNLDWQSVWPANTYTISHAPIYINYTSGSGYYNDWDQGMANITGGWFSSGETSWALYNGAGDWASANPSGVSTVQGGSISGGYSGSQSITGLSYNCIALPAGAYKIKVYDTENGLVASTQCDFSCAVSTPVSWSYSQTGYAVGRTSSGVQTVTFTPTLSAHRMYGATGISWAGPGFKKVNNGQGCNGFLGCCAYCNDASSVQAWSLNATGVSFVANRSAKQVYIAHTITINRRYNYWSGSASCSLGISTCSHQGCNTQGYYDYENGGGPGGDVSSVTVTGGWGSTNLGAAVQITQ